MEQVILAAYDSQGNKLELPVSVTHYGENLLSEPDTSAWNPQDGSVTAMPGYLYWDTGSYTVAQHSGIYVEAFKTYELRFDGIILDAPAAARLIGSGADDIEFGPAAAFGTVGTFIPTSTGTFPLRILDANGLSSGRIRNFELREIVE